MKEQVISDNKVLSVDDSFRFLVSKQTWRLKSGKKLNVVWSYPYDKIIEYRISELGIESCVDQRLEDTTLEEDLKKHLAAVIQAYLLESNVELTDTAKELANKLTEYFEPV